MNEEQLTPLELSALVSSRICHDVLGPVGAIINGIEVLEDDDDGDMAEFALDLIKKSSAQISAKLQFVRLSMGAAGSVGSQLALGDACKLAQQYLVNEKAELTWNCPEDLSAPKNDVKLLLNLFQIAITIIPRGGTVSVDCPETLDNYTITAEGMNARIPPHVEELVTGQGEASDMDAHRVQAYYTGLLAQSINTQVRFYVTDDKAVIEVTRNPAS